MSEHPIVYLHDMDPVEVAAVGYLLELDLQTWEEVAARTPKELLRHPGIGPVRLRRAIDRLDRLGISHSLVHPEDRPRCPCCGRRMPADAPDALPPKESS